MSVHARAPAAVEKQEAVPGAENAPLHLSLGGREASKFVALSGEDVQHPSQPCILLQ